MAVSLNTALGAFPITALAGTAYVPLAGGTMTGALTLPAGTAAAPSLTFAGDTDSGFYLKAANEVGVTVNGTLCAYWNTSAFWFTGPGGGGVFDNTAPLIVGSSGDTKWYRDGGNGLMALRNGTNAQTLRVYNTYTDASNYERLTLSGVAGTSVNITAETLGTGGDNLDIVLTPAGTGGVIVANSKKLTAVNIGTYATEDSCTLHAYNAYGLIFEFGSAKKGYMNTDGFKLAAANYYGWVSDTDPVGSAADTALFRNAAGVVEVNNGTAGTWRDLKLRNLIQTEYSQLTEMTAPSAPATNSVRIYAEDNGSGKTRLMALFATGAAQQLAIEP